MRSRYHGDSDHLVVAGEDVVVNAPPGADVSSAQRDDCRDDVVGLPALPCWTSGSNQRERKEAYQHSKRDCLANPTRHIEGELILGGALASVEGSSHLGNRAPA